METLKPYWRNPRKNEDAVPAVVESIKRYGFNQPLVVDTKGVIIVGHTRYRAALELELAEVPVIVMDAPAKLVKEYRIADNKTGEIADWDRDTLIPELREMDIPGMEVFFPGVDLHVLLADTSGAQVLAVTQADVDAILNKPGNGILKQQLDSTIKLECIHCGGEIYVDRSVIESHGGEA
jgi:hypothetical protein